MRITLVVIAVIASGASGASVLVVSPGEAAAQNAPSSVIYEGGFEEITNSCSKEQGMALSKSTVKLARKGESVEVTISGVPSMTGRLRRGGSFRAEAKGPRPEQKDIEGRYSATGRANERRVQLVFVAEFYRGTTPVCTQSWDVTGARK